MKKIDKKIRRLRPEILELGKRGYTPGNISRRVGLSKKYVEKVLQEALMESEAGTIKEMPKPEPEPESAKPEVKEEFQPPEVDVPITDQIIDHQDSQIGEVSAHEIDFWEIPDQYFEKSVPTEMSEILSEISFTLAKMEEMMSSVFIERQEQATIPDPYAGLGQILDIKTDEGGSGLKATVHSDPGEVKIPSFLESQGNRWQRKIGILLLVIGFGVLAVSMLGVKLW